VSGTSNDRDHSSRVTVSLTAFLTPTSSKMLTRSDAVHRLAVRGGGSPKPFIATHGHATLTTDKWEFYDTRRVQPRARLAGGRHAVAYGRVCKSKPLKAAPISAVLNDRGARTSRGGAWYDSA
jgi:hypothetical protein